MKLWYKACLMGHKTYGLGRRGLRTALAGVTVFLCGCPDQKQATNTGVRKDQVQRMGESSRDSPTAEGRDRDKPRDSDVRGELHEAPVLKEVDPRSAKQPGEQ